MTLPEGALELAQYIDHTQLKPQARREDIEQLCSEALEYGFYSVCVNGVWVPYCRSILSGSEVRISAVVGFPLGAASSAVKAYEASVAVDEGATEIDMVVPVGHLLDRADEIVLDHIRAVVKAVQGRALVKVILETGLLDDELIKMGCKLAEKAGAHFVKTSTGFGAGGATEADVRLMRSSVSPSLGVKASGGIRDRQAAMQMIAAGATRLGTSAGVAIVRGESGTAAY